MELRIETPVAGSSWHKVYVGADEFGGLGLTTRSDEDMRWYWSAAGTYGYAATKDQALAEMRAVLPDWLTFRANDAERERAFAALPAHLQELEAAAVTAEFDRNKAWGRNPFSDADYREASDRAHRARLAFNAAHDAWQSQREAA